MALLPPDFLTKLTKIPCAGRLIGKLALRASAEQLIPVFSLLLEKLPTDMIEEPLVEWTGSYSECQAHRFWSESPCDDNSHLSPSILRDMIYFAATTTLAQVLEAVDFLTRLFPIMSFPKLNRNCLQICYGILHCLFLRRDTPVLPVDSALLATWQLFFTQCPPANKEKMTLCPIVTKLVVDCSDLQLVIASGMVPSFFSRMEDQGHDGHFLQCFLDIVDHILTGKQRRGDSVLGSLH